MYLASPDELFGAMLKIEAASDQTDAMLSIAYYPLSEVS